MYVFTIHQTWKHNLPAHLFFGKLSFWDKIQLEKADKSGTDVVVVAAICVVAVTFLRALAFCGGYKLLSLFPCPIPSILKGGDSLSKRVRANDPWQKKTRSESFDIQCSQQEPTA